MGTSGSYGGPTGANPLVPPWADEEDGENGSGPAAGDELGDDETHEDNQTPPRGVDTLWRVPKGRLTSIAKEGGGDYGKAAGGFVKSLGGSRSATATSTSGRRAAGNLVRFASSVASVGAEEAARQFGLENYLGQDASVLLAGMAARLAPDGQLHEDSVARRAMIRTLSELFEEWVVEDQGLDALSQLDRGALEDIITTYISNYIGERLLSNLFDRVERYAASETVAHRIEREILEFVQRSVDLTLEERDVMEIDWGGEQGQDIIDDFFERGYRVLEAMA